MKRTVKMKKEFDLDKIFKNAKWIIGLTLLAIFIVVVILVVIRYQKWGIHITQEDVENNGKDAYEYTNDEMFVMTERAEGYVEDGETTVVIMGNNPFGDDFFSENNLGNLFAKETGFNVINMSVSGSYLATYNRFPQELAYEYDAYAPYWLFWTMYLRDSEPSFMERLEFIADRLGDEGPENRWDIIDKLKTVDLSKVDSIVLCYDGTDYLLDKPVSIEQGDMILLTFSGTFVSTIELIQEKCPWIQIIVMSAPYAFALDEDGNMISSDKKVNSWGNTLSDFTAHELHYSYNNFVTYIDNIYGTITEDNADEYLLDNIRLNLKGRKLMNDRLVEAFHKLGY